MFKDNWQYRIMAVVMAVFFWYLISGQEKVEMWVEVPVEISSLPAEHAVKSGMVGKVNVRCRATRAMLTRMDAGRLAYNLDLSGVEQGTNTIALDPKRINLPRAVQAVEIAPSRLELEVDRLVSREVPVRINWKAALDPHHELKYKKSTPELIRVRGPERIVERVDAVESRTIEVEDGRPGTISRKVGLELHPDVEASAAEVRVEIVFGPVLEEIWVRKPIEVRSAEGIDYRLGEDHARVHLALPVKFLQETGWRDTISYFIRLNPQLQPGEHELPLELELPEHSEVLEKRPEKVEVTIIQPQPLSR